MNCKLIIRVHKHKPEVEFVLLPEDGSNREYSGDSIEEAIDYLQHDYNKHDLWSGDEE